jgi:3-hydroxy-9,10-secoandrosta-1,3,5(10)-triene-9,17-dione monooxygenase
MSSTDSVKGETVCRIPPRNRDWLTRDELGRLTPQILAQRLNSLTTLVAHGALEAERLRRPVDAVWSAIRKTGLLYHFVPKRYGGLEFDLDSFINVLLPIGEGCASTAWVAAFCMQHNWLLAQFPEAAQDEVFSQFPYITAPATHSPPGKAEVVDGGFRLSGRWKWGTGVMHSDWVILGGLVASAHAPPELRFFLSPIEEVTVIDTWRMDGMIATGSNDIIAAEVFVPGHRTLRVGDLRSGNAFGPQLHRSWIYRLPMPLLAALAAAVAAVGAARASVHHFAQRIRAGDPKFSEKPAALIRLAASKLEATSAERILRSAAKQATLLVQHSSSPVPLWERVEIRVNICYAVELSRTAVRRIAEASGSAAHSLDNPLQRAVRDLGVISSHALLDMDSVEEAYGRTLVGLPPNTMIDGN